tara:strand:+ start:61 stop:483 length:423 start_codon:yes stop_codon:yes gene_type:complete
MILPKTIPIYGDTTFRGKCHKEHVEQASFFSKIRKEYPDSYGLLAIHPRNEGQLIGGQFSAMQKHKLEGLSKGASDIIIPGRRAFVCELKRSDHTQSKWQEGQLEYLQAADAAGCFACVALGASAAWEAFREWVATQAPA